MELLLNRKLVRSATRCLLRSSWRGHTSADDSWLRLEELAHCQENETEYDAVAPRLCATRRAARTALPAAAPPAAPAPARMLAPAGFRVAAPTEALAGTALVGQPVLYLWPDYGWVRGTVARRSRAAGFSHVVRYSRASSGLWRRLRSWTPPRTAPRAAGCSSVSLRASLASLQRDDRYCSSGGRTDK